MKKTRVFPFERNRYFYGKLLTVRDFETEQKYFNDKRRLLNRLLFGSGVVAGMQVVAVDDKTITVEMGLAIDYAGREIVIPAPVTTKLSMIDGFTNNEYKKNVYLYAAYDERGREPVHSVGNSSIRGEEVSEYNRLLESYRLFIREEAPDLRSFEHVRLLEDIAVLYQDEHVRIYQSMPKYVNPDDVVDVELVVEKTLQTPRVKLSFVYEADGFTTVGAGKPEVEFSESGDGQETELRMSYSIKALDRPGTVGKLLIPSDRLELHIGDQRIPVAFSVTQTAQIISEPVMDRLLKDWYERSLDQAAEGSSDREVCLARIGLMQLGPTYMIEQVERVPFGEYVPNVALTQLLNATQRKGGLHRFYAESTAKSLDYHEQPKLDVSYDPDRNTFSFNLGIPQPQAINDEIATGLLEVPLQATVKNGSRLFSRGQRNYVSDEIDHGLGEGAVAVLVGLEDVQKGSGVYYESIDVFEGTEFEASVPQVRFGVIVYPNSGKFRIGMKLVDEETELEFIRVRWWAFKKLPEGSAGGNLSSLLEAARAEAAAEREE